MESYAEKGSCPKMGSYPKMGFFHELGSSFFCPTGKQSVLATRTRFASALRSAQ